MLPKNGDLTDPGNWRPIAVLKTLYRLLSRMIYNRIRPHLQPQQPPDQYGFQPDASIEETLLVVECVSSRSLEWHVPVLMASLDLRKAFDKVDHSSLFSALRIQQLPECYVHFLAALYRDQTGCTSKSKKFSIKRGVCQGDVVSPLLFNAALESAFRS